MANVSAMECCLNCSREQLVWCAVFACRSDWGWLECRPPRIADDDRPISAGDTDVLAKCVEAEVELLGQRRDDIKDMFLHLFDRAAALVGI